MHEIYLKSKKLYRGLTGPTEKSKDKGKKNLEEIVMKKGVLRKR